MNSFSRKRFKEIKDRFGNFNVAVVGDMMLDSYLWGDVKRISPEAPVPVVEIDNEFFRFGGAANVAFNLVKLGGTPVPFGIIGDDKNGEIFSGLLNEVNITNDFLIKDKSRPTTTKTRVISSDQQIVRIDKESKKLISEEIEEELLSNFEKRIPSIDAIILEDYNKGVLTKSLIQKVISIANKHNKIITVDPKFANFYSYNNVTVFKPNLKEAEEALGVKAENKNDIIDIGKSLIERLHCKYLLLTLGANGMAIFEKDKAPLFIPTKARKVLDVSGAGDTVIATLTFALLSGANISEATFFANYAGGLVCEEAGVVPITEEKLFNKIESEIE